MTTDLTITDDESRKAGVDRPKQFLLPHSGEVIDLSSPSDKLAAVLYEIRDVESRLREAKGELSEELYRRMDANAKWTERFGHFQVVGKSPEPEVKYDGDRLFDALRSLVDQGHISLEAAESAIQVKREARKRGVNALLKLGGKVRTEIEACELPPEAPRRYLKVDAV